MKRLVFILLVLISFGSRASHIVGGEFELIHLANGKYQLNLVYYYDSLNSQFTFPPRDSEPVIWVSIFRKSDNKFMDSVQLNYFSKEIVTYSQSECSKGNVVITEKLIYSSTSKFELPANRYNDPQGYYVAWERCCRNYSIVNIFSDDPGKTGVIIPAGQTFYLEFPPVVRNGQPFINSSPQHFPPLRDYACPLRRYYADFAGVDSDGDSLVYSKVVPFSTHSAKAVPVTKPLDYPLITWRSPYDFDNIMGGVPDFQISPKGYVTVTPGSKGGLFVFAVKCEEFRNGVKIGETRRDFQLVVSTSCNESAATSSPRVTGRKLGDPTFSLVNNPLYIEFQNTVSDENRCLEVQVADPDVFKASDSFQEHITNLQIMPINFDANLDDLLPTIKSFYLKKDVEETRTFKVCFPECPYIEGPFQIGIAAYDDACALPLGDTLMVTVNVIPPLNNKPIFTPPAITATVLPGSLNTWQIHATDLDKDVLVDKIVAFGFNLQDADMTYTVISNVAGTGDYQAELKWNPDCTLHKYHKNQFMIQIFLEDEDKCGFDHPAIMTINLTLDDEHTSPFITSPSIERSDSIEVTLTVNSSILFDVIAKQSEGDFIVLTGKGKDFNMNDYGAVFTTANGNGLVSSPFTWDIKCNTVNLADRDRFDFEFIVVDNKTVCEIYRADTLDYIIKIKPPDNIDPLLKIYNAKTNLPVTDTLSIATGELISLTLIGSDQDISPVDFLTIDLAQVDGTVEPVTGYTFTTHNKFAPADATFMWQPDCSIFRSGVYTNKYEFMFKVSDDRCITNSADTSVVYVKVSDVESNDKGFNPSNVITPNDDGCNDYFALEDIESPNPECPPRADDLNASVGLPKDNCYRHFENIRIYNRWGNMVFSSRERNFRWYAKDTSLGVYYYYINYTDKVFKGTVSVLF